MNQLTQISPVSDAEAARMARPSTFADLAERITAEPPSMDPAWRVAGRGDGVRLKGGGGLWGCRWPRYLAVHRGIRAAQLREFGDKRNHVLVRASWSSMSSTTTVRHVAG
jgi:hypothetical protein